MHTLSKNRKDGVGIWQFLPGVGIWRHKLDYKPAGSAAATDESTTNITAPVLMQK